MGQTPRDHRTEPSLELPSIPRFGHRKKSRKSRRTAESSGPPESTYDGPEPATDLPESTYDGPEPATAGAAAVDSEPPSSAGPSLNGYGPDGQDFDGHGLDGRSPDAEDPDTEDLDTQAPRRRAEKRRTEQAPKEPRKQRSKPLLPGPVAAVLTGIFVGAAGAAGTYGAMTGCEAVRGVSTCGGAPGFFILVTIVALMILLGAGVLRLAKVDDPASTSFLAVGLVAVVAMLVLLDVIFSPWMFLVIPALTAVAFLLAQWVTSRFTGDTGRRDWT